MEKISKKNVYSRQKFQQKNLLIYMRGGILSFSSTNKANKI